MSKRNQKPEYRNQKKLILVTGYWLLVTLVIGFWVLSLGFSANAQMLYNGIYWVDGTILPPASDAAITTNDRMVVFYQLNPDDGYASDTSGTAGLSGRSGEFMLNAMEDWRMNLLPGTYKIATVKGADNYGVNPVDITISGKGWDTSPNLQLAYGQGIAKPGKRTPPDWLASEIPVIKSIMFDGKLYQQLVSGGKQLKFYASSQPKVSVRVTAGNVGIDKNTLSVVLDEGAAVSKTFTLNQFSDYTEIPGANLPKEIDYSLNLKSLGETLTDGDHAFTFYAGNMVGTTSTMAAVSVTSALSVVGTPINYPSPLHLSTDNQVVFQYGLTKDANIDIYVFDITGTIVKKLSSNAGQNGGQGGGSAAPNKVVWNLMTDQGTRIGVGIYLWEIVSRDNNKVLQKGKLAAGP